MVDARELFNQGYVAQVLAMLGNCHRDPKQRSSPFDVYDFMPKESRPRRSKKNSEASLDLVFSQFPKEEKK
jgi:hypothetical protein|tara:strand:+ start:12039 stop:12251 length:213 start_codon:yes stop_codon:yes gene_type:complete